MARPKKPSELRGWFKLSSNILDDDRLQACSADEFRFYIQLLAMLNRARSGDGVIELSRRSLMACANREQFRHALRIARAGAARGLYTLRVDGAHTLITVSKWSEYNGNGSEQGRPLKTKDLRLKTKDKEGDKNAPDGSSPRAKAKSKTVVPDFLPEDQMTEVLRWAANHSPPIETYAVDYGWEVFTSKAKANGYRYVDHAQAFKNALGASGEAWALNGLGKFKDAAVKSEERRLMAEWEAKHSPEMTEEMENIMEMERNESAHR